MNKNFEKSYQRFDSSIKKSAQNEFFADLINSIQGGNSVLAHKSINDFKVFTDDWVERIYVYLKQVEKIVFNPRKFIKENSEIVPVELAKKTTKDSVIHLSRNTHLIREKLDNDDVIPSKIKTTYKEEDLEIYENLFINTLINKTSMFVEKRYNTIQEHLECKRTQILDVDSNFNFRETDIKVKLNVEIHENLKDSEAQQKNLDVLRKITELKRYIGTLKKSKLLVALQNSKRVNAPIMKTNIIMKEPSYRAGYQLWIYLDTYDKLGYEIDESVIDLIIDNKYLEDIYSLLSYSSVVPLYNISRNYVDYDNLPSKSYRKKPITVDNDKIVETILDEEIVYDEDTISQVLYDKMTKKASDLFDEHQKGRKVTYEAPYKKVSSDLRVICDNILSDIIDKNIDQEDYSSRLKVLQAEKLNREKSLEYINDLILKEKTKEKIEDLKNEYNKKVFALKTKYSKKKETINTKISEVVALKNELKVNKANKPLIDEYKQRLVRLRADYDKVKRELEASLETQAILHRKKVKELKDERDKKLKK